MILRAGDVDWRADAPFGIASE